MFRWSADARSTRCTAQIWRPSPWATATIRKTQRDLFESSACPRAHVRRLAWRWRSEDVVGAVPTEARSRFERWQRSFPLDRRLLGHELEASRAHARALQRAGILLAEELASILFGLDQIA